MLAESQNLAHKSFSSALIGWYEINKRDLPWRETDDPYVIWLSEIILQQTRVQQGLPYFEKFLDTFPDIRSFAKASEQEILKLWQGLGYYSRARNMLTCAKELVGKYGGQFPGDYDKLLKLKGVGQYTAAAIASFSFKIPVAVIDGNVFRVLSRIYGIDHDIAETKNYRTFKNKAQDLISQEHPDKFNQAIMEFGALQCTPRLPECEKCIFMVRCFAYKHNLQSLLPVKKKKIKKRTRYFNYFRISFEDKTLVQKRGSNDIWQGMYEFFLVESPEERNVERLLINEAKILADHGNFVTCSSNYKHVLTHQTIFAKFLKFSINNENSFKVIMETFALEAVKSDGVFQLPVSRLMDKYLKKEINFVT